MSCHEELTSVAPAALSLGPLWHKQSNQPQMNPCQMCTGHEAQGYEHTKNKIKNKSVLISKWYHHLLVSQIAWTLTISFLCFLLSFRLGWEDNDSKHSIHSFSTSLSKTFRKCDKHSPSFVFDVLLLLSKYNICTKVQQKKVWTGEFKMHSILALNMLRGCKTRFLQ